MGKFRNHEKASFWSADTDEGGLTTFCSALRFKLTVAAERSELVKSARGGGSITPRFAKISDCHVRSGQLSIHTHTVVSSATFSPTAGTWSITTDPPISDLPPIDFIYFATGVHSDFETLPYLKNIVEKYPIEAYDGLPALTDDLMWKEDVPLFVTGKFAALRLGPGAGNLEGARLGGERVAWGMEDVFGEKDAEAEDLDRRDSNSMRYAAGIGSRFEALGEVD